VSFESSESDGVQGQRREKMRESFLVNMFLAERMGILDCLLEVG